MNKENIIEKIRKLRALSSSSNINEAETAARMVEKLIQQYQIAEAELELQEGDNESAIYDDNPLTNWGARQNLWQNFLATALCKAYNCEGLLQRKEGKVNFYLVGRPSDIEIVRYNFAFFTLEIVRLADLAQPKGLFRGEAKGWRNSFYQGAVSSLVEALKQEKDEVRKEASSSALVILNKHQEEAKALIEKLFHITGDAKQSIHINRDAYNKGKEAGANLRSKPSLPSGPKLLKG